MTARDNNKACWQTACLNQKLLPFDSYTVFPRHSTPRDLETLASHSNWIPEKPQMNLTLTALLALWRQQGYARFRGPWGRASCLCPWTLSLLHLLTCSLSCQGKPHVLDSGPYQKQRCPERPCQQGPAPWRNQATICQPTRCLLPPSILLETCSDSLRLPLGVFPAFACSLQ